MSETQLTVAQLIAHLTAFDPDEPVWMDADGGMAPVGGVERYRDEDHTSEVIIVPSLG